MDISLFISSKNLLLTQQKYLKKLINSTIQLKQRKKLPKRAKTDEIYSFSKDDESAELINFERIIRFRPILTDTNSQKVKVQTPRNFAFFLTITKSSIEILSYNMNLYLL